MTQVQVFQAGEGLQEGCVFDAVMRQIQKSKSFRRGEEGVRNVLDFVMTEVEVVKLSGGRGTLEKAGRFSRDSMAL